MVNLFASNVSVGIFLSTSVEHRALNRHFEARNEAVLKLSFTLGSIKKVFC